jgi:hypothetical protein
MRQSGIPLAKKSKLSPIGSAPARTYPSRFHVEPQNQDFFNFGRFLQTSARQTLEKNNERKEMKLSSLTNSPKAILLVSISLLALIIWTLISLVAAAIAPGGQVGLDSIAATRVNPQVPP